MKISIFGLICSICLASLASGAFAFDVEPAQPSSCDEVVLVAMRSFTSECGWSATAAVNLTGTVIGVSLELHSAGGPCLEVLVDETFQVPLGSFPPGEYTLSVAWSDLDQRPEEKPLSIADEACPEEILRGDANRDGEVDLADAVFLLIHLFAGGKAPDCEPAADADANGEIEVTDAIYVLEYLFVSGPAPTALGSAEAEACRPPPAFTLSSSAFLDGEAIPSKYSCDGDRVSPPLSWNGAPAGTRSFALTCLDPDAPSGSFVHWLAWDIPASASSLAEGAKPTVVGTNGSNGLGYTGPCPPRKAGFHHYIFTLYALDADSLSLPSSTRRAALEAAMAGHILAQVELTGLYRRD